MTKRYSLIVVYNKELDKSPTYKLCREYNNLITIVCDNSTTPNNNQNIAKKDGVIYISMNGNKGLSCAYNAGINEIQSKNGYIMIMDDDTEIPRTYIEWFLSAELHDTDIYLPIVKDEKGVMSPSKNVKGVVYRSQDTNISYSEITGINSGMIINLSCFKDFSYDEKLFLDYVDHYFLIEMKKRNKKIEVLPFEIYQNFSANTNSKKSAIVRWNIFKRDSKYFYRNHKKNYFFILLKRRIRLMLQYKDLTFLWR